MDCLILKNPGEGVITHLTTSLKEHAFAETFVFRPSAVDSIGLDEAISRRISASPNKPVFLVIDLDKGLKDWDMPILSILQSRIVAGQQLPDGSKVFVAANVGKDDLEYELSSATVARLVVVDLKTKTPLTNFQTHEASIKGLVADIAGISHDEMTKRKSGIVKEMHPDAVDIKMAGKPSLGDLSTYPVRPRLGS